MNSFMVDERLRLAPGSRVVVRDAEWIIRRVEPSSDGGQIVHCDGISEMSRNRSAVFLSTLDDIEILDPGTTQLVADPSNRYSGTILYVESLLRQIAPNDRYIHVSHKAAMDRVGYQLEPALQSLAQARQRMLIADSVGLGKTLEAGILVSELVHRGRGNRILVLTLKSMLTQFQKEFWNRFSIPLTRLDSIGLHRVRSHIPTNHNPFHYYDKSIISIDTLKQDNEYRVYLEQAWWDIIIVDEAHNVADRGTRSQRARLAKLLASRSDSLIMLSATPHDGRAKSFASLINMLDPTAIPDPENYSHEDFRNKGLVVRRFKKDIQQQVDSEFRQRRTFSHPHDANSYEEAAYEALLKIRFTRAGKFDRHHAFSLVRITLQKALFSSPAACLQSVRKRMKKLQKANEEEAADDIIQEISDLEDFLAALENIPTSHFSKYQALVALVQDRMNWKTKSKTDRLVIFSERIETLNFLMRELKLSLGLKEGQIEILDGGLSDIDQQNIVEDFGRLDAPLRVLLCSDVASEGINLHYQSHRLVHFDIPWSLMVFQQRNGRIDRYGQEHEPEIHYLMTRSQNSTIRGDMRILEILQEKDEQAYKNIGDPSAFMHVYDVEKEEKLTAQAMHSGVSADEFDEKYQPEKNEGEDLLAMFLGTDNTDAAEESDGQAQTTGRDPFELVKERPSLFADNYDYCRRALEYLNENEARIQFSPQDDSRSLTLGVPDDLLYRFKKLPKEIGPRDGQIVLSEDKELIRREIARSREDENAWPKIHYLWEQSPVVQWIDDRMLAAFGRHEAPVVALGDLPEGECVFIVSGLIPNKKGHPLIHEWMCLVFAAGVYQKTESFSELIERTGFGHREIANRDGEGETGHFAALLPAVVEKARELMKGHRSAFRARIEPELEKHKSDLLALQKRQFEQLELALSKKPELVRAGQREDKKREIDRAFDDYQKWVGDTMKTEDQPHIRIICVLHNWSL